MRRATLKLIMSFRPCYSEDKVLAAMGGRKSLSVGQCATLDIPAKDRLWGMFRVWPEFVSATLDIAVERAIRRVLGKSGSPKWEDWANAWIDGTDRSADAAATRATRATRAARAADAAADSAAYAAAYAAYAAAYAADGYAAYAAYYAAADAAEMEQIVADFCIVAKEAK